MNRVSFYLVLMTSAWISACMPSTVAELKKESVPHRFTVDFPYQSVYRNLIESLEECAFGGFLFTKTKVERELYPDLKLGEIRLTYNNMGDKSVFIYIEVHELEEGKTSTVLAHTTGDHYASMVESRARAGNSDCE